MRNIVAISATSLLLLTACGGQAEAVRRPESAPTFAVLASPAGLGATDLRAGRPESARALLDDVVARGDAREQQIALVNLGAIHAADGYLVAAQAHFDTARSIDPSRPEPAYALALLADVRGQRVRAAELAREALRLDDGGAARAGLAFLFPEERAHLEALLAEARGDREAALSRWRELRAGRFPALSAAAQRRLDE